LIILAENAEKWFSNTGLSGCAGGVHSATPDPRAGRKDSAGEGRQDPPDFTL